MGATIAALKAIRSLARMWPRVWPDAETGIAQDIAPGPAIESVSDG